MGNGTNGSGVVGWRVWIVGIVGVLVAIGVGGAIRNAIAQGQLETQVEANQREFEKEIGHVIVDLNVIKRENKEAHKTIVMQMKEDKKEILDAIEALEK